jgi:flagellar biosynthesis/type III secretory pathway chaperone
MTTAIQSIQEQIESCKQLLEMFKEEHQKYLESDSISVKEVIRTLQNKQKLLSMFEKQKQQFIACDEDTNEDEQPQRKQLLRELSSLLEQLLVIDQENELLLRNLMPDSNKPAKSNAQPPRRTSPRRSSGHRIRNAYGNDTTETTTNANAPAAPATSSVGKSDTEPAASAGGSTRRRVNSFARFNESARVSKYV